MFDKTCSRQLQFISLIFLIVSNQAFGQDKIIDRAQYFAAYDAADTKSEASFPRVMTVTLEYFEKNKTVRVEKSTYEYETTNVVRTSIELDNKGKKSTSKQIQIGGVYFCQQDGKAFEKSAKPCERPLMGMGGSVAEENFSKREIMVGDEKLVEYRMSKKGYPTIAQGKKTAYFSEQIFRVRQDGRYSEFLIDSGYESDIKMLSMRSRIRYTYDAVFPRIESPIK